MMAFHTKPEPAGVPLRAYLVSLTLATVLPVALLGAIVGYFLVKEQRETFRRGAEGRTLAVLTAVDVELQGAIGTLEALATLPAFDAGFDAHLTKPVTPDRLKHTLASLS